MKNSLPERIKQIRSTLSQSAFSQKLGVKQQTYSNWERGKTEPTLSQICSIAATLGVSADYLLGLSDSQTLHHNAPVAISASGGSVVQSASPGARISTHSPAPAPSDSAEIERLRGEVDALNRTVAALLDRLAAKQ